MTAVDTQVIVVGAGPVGLLLAAELRLGGAEVTVLEERATPTDESRASTLHARTMELLDQRGLLGELGTPPHEPRGHFGGIPLDLTLPGPYPGQWKVPQVRTEELLGSWAQRLGARLLRRHRVRGLTQHPGHVTVEAESPDGPLRMTARYVVGCDGEKSTVRDLGSFDFPGTSAQRELLRADVAGIDVPDRRFQRLPGGLAIAARRADGVTRVMVHAYDHIAQQRTTAPEFAEVVEIWRSVTGEDIAHGTPLWVNSFGDASRQVTRYRDRRVLLAGDAAHQQLPVGGQALNLGLQDAANLGWKLAATVQDRAPDGLLDTYHDERHAVGRRVLSNIQAQARLLLGGPEVEGLRTVVAELIGQEDVRRHLAGMISGLDIRYGTGHPLEGARLPYAEVATDTGPTSTLALLRSARPQLLLLTGDPGQAERLRRACAPWQDTVDTVTVAVTEKAAASGLPTDAAALLVRPDGYVAWAGQDEQSLTAAIGRWCAPRAPRLDHRLDHRPDPRPRAPHTIAPHTDRTGRFTMGQLTGKTALVTGASRGIGRAIAERLASDGALVCVHYSKSEDEACDVVEGIEKNGGRAFKVCAHLGTTGDVHDLFLGLETGLKERTGSTQLDILVNNAGIMGGVQPQDTMPVQFDRLFAVNAKAPFFIIQRALSKNIPDGGRIINISSGLTRFANPDEIAYAMTKGAVEMLALHYAKFLGPRNITINSVAPGITRNSNPVFENAEAVKHMSALSTFNRVGEPEDIADVVAFLASDDARWVTGSFVDASGGTLLG
ncbi:SDR family oxidoreductase [Streptomyces monticola]|uniref:SDR family oxidoreductase n=1 Tax=Streptomyces monticola TaxID=2666263 RepID=A0ABW2JVB7_9ACTN